MHSCAACLAFHSNETLYLFLEHKIGNGDFGESATNCSVNDKEEKKKRIASFHIVTRLFSSTVFNRSREM